jgi:uncharacterized protein (TIGR03435 family)
MMTELSLIAKATLILVVSLFATRAAHRSRASVRSLILAAAFGLVLVLPIASAIAPARDLQIPNIYATRFLIAEEIVDQRADFGSAIPSTSAAPAPWRLPSTQVLTRAAWLLGTAATLLPLLLGLWRLRGIRRRSHDWPHGRELVDAMRQSIGMRRSVAVVLHDDVAAPMTCGWMRPAIAMPTDAPRWPASDVRQALLHELEHVRRQDWPVHILARITCSLYWFHPLAWMAWRQLSLESERACDDAVVTKAEHTAYAEQLVTLARRLSKGRAVPLLSMADHRTLSTRITSILSTTTARGRVGTLAAALVLTGAAALAGAIAPLQPRGAQPAVSGPEVTINPLLRFPIAPLPGAAQGAAAGPNPSFEVASIKPNVSGLGGSGQGTRPGGAFIATNVSLLRLVQFAYDAFDSQVVGGPDWIRNDRFDVTAKAPAYARPDQVRLMMRALLEDRFHLRLRTEKRDMPMFELLLARSDGRVGPNLHDCSNKGDQAGLSSSEKPFTAPRGGSVAAGDCSSLATGVVRLIASRMQAPVIDKTGLGAEFRYDIYFGPDLPQPDAANPDLPSFATALREQLGLKVERTRGMVDVLVIESAAQPAAD